MTHERDLDRAVRSWLRTDGGERVDGILESVLAGLDAHPQRRRGWGATGLRGAPYSGRVLGFAAALVLLVLLTITMLPIAFPIPTESTAPTAGPSAGVVATTSPSMLPSPSPAPSPSPMPSAAPSPTAAPPTAAPPRTPRPDPTLDWAEVGYALGIRSPVARGTTARVAISAPVGPTCSLAVTYPGGAAAQEGSPAHPDPGRWVWTWTVPNGTPLGTAIVDTACTYQGLTKDGTGSFEVVDAPPDPTPKPTKTPNPSWSISGSVNTPISAGTPLTFTGHVNGTPPAGNGPIDLHCTLYVTYPGGFDTVIADDGFVNTRDFTLSGSLGSNPPTGTHPWRVVCRALNGASRTTSGDLEIQ